MTGGRRSLLRTDFRSSPNLPSGAALTSLTCKQSTVTSSRICRSIGRVNCAATHLAGARLAHSKVDSALMRFTTPMTRSDSAPMLSCATLEVRPASRPYPLTPLPRLYGDLDFVHGFHEGNSRTLREFTRSLAEAAGYDLSWSSTNVTAAERNRLYIARDIAVLERAFPGLTPQRGMETNDRAEYEASLALQALRRVPGVSLEAIIREGLAPRRAPDQAPATSETQAAPPDRPRGTAAERALAALARHEAATTPDTPIKHTAIADRGHHPRQATDAEPGPAPGQTRQSSAADRPVRYRTGPEPGF
jgi:hypothetical protein